MSDRTDYDWIVVGGGFKSLVAAYAFARSGHSVLLLERGTSLGGFMSPIKWGDFYIDKGPQFFDNFEEADKEFITEMVGDDVFEDIGFKYASYINGTKTDDFAIPDWRTMGSEFSADVFKDLVQRRARQNGTPYQAQTFDDLLDVDGGALLTPALRDLTRKFLRQDPETLSVHARKMVTFIGRKLLFDQDTSLDLKQSPMLDGLLAAQKVSLGDGRYNLYPKGANLEKVRAAMEQAVRDAGVVCVMECGETRFDTDAHLCEYASGSARYDRVFFGCDAREAETCLFGTDTLAKTTHFLPEIFHCFSVPADALDPAYYLVDYDMGHKSTRMTNFTNFMMEYDADGFGVFCVEQAIDAGSADWNDPSALQDEIFREAQEAGNVSCDSYKTAQSFRIPVTYKVPRVGFSEAANSLAERSQAKGGGSIVIPNPMSLTRKESLDDLRALELL